MSSTRGVVGISSSSDPSRAARAIATAIQKRGWVELSCYGGPLTTQRGIEVRNITDH
jgi:stage V sporulation protein SpoVS